MHRNLYLLESKDVDTALKGFIYEFADLYFIEEENKYNYDLDKNMINKFRDEFWSKEKGHEIEYLAWISYNLNQVDVGKDKKYEFLSRFIELLDEDKTEEQKKIYCSECAYFVYNCDYPRCWASENIKVKSNPYKQKIDFKSTPFYINEKNDCKYYKKKTFIDKVKLFLKEYAYRKDRTC